MTRRAALVLLFGIFFAACATQLYTIEDAGDAYQDGNYHQALEITNHLLAENPQNIDLLLIKASSIDELAVTVRDPFARNDYYREFAHVADQIRDVGDSDDLNRIRQLIHRAWSREVEAAERFLESLEEDESVQNYEPVIAHFDNAIIIRPNHADAYREKAAVHIRQGNHGASVSTLHRAEENLRPFPQDLKEKLAYLFLEEGKMDDAVELYRQLYHSDPDNTEFKHALVNVYILSEQHMESVGLLRDLVEMAPENLDYHQSLATELYYHIGQSLDSIRDSTLDEGEIDHALEELLEDLEEAESHFRYVLDNHPNPEEVTFIAAAFYKNTAGRLASFARDVGGELAETLNRTAIDLLEQSVPIWEKVFERNPENPEVRNSLYQIYSALGMEEEAEEIQLDIQEFES